MFNDSSNVVDVVCRKVFADVEAYCAHLLKWARHAVGTDAQHEASSEVIVTMPGAARFMM